MTRIEKEKRIIALMVQFYCKHKLQLNELPTEYAELITYAHRRLTHCKFGEQKKACKKCPIHCYAPQKREMMRQVMKWCGPRMLIWHPIITLKHYL